MQAELRNAELPYSHIEWLQQRFPNAKYENVIGLCKLADRAQIEEQDFSLNPGRYVGVVIEDDGRTQEEFLDEINAKQETFESLTEKARDLEEAIAANVNEIMVKL